MTHDDDLSRLLHDAVADVEPTDRLAAIRHRTQEAPMNRKPWLTVALGAAAAVAAVVVGISVLGDGGDPAPPVASPSESSEGSSDADPTGAAEPSASAEPSESASAAESTEPAPSETSSAGDDLQGAVPLYFIGDTERAGPRLYREYQRGTPEELTSVLELLAGTPRDPDYRTAWRPGLLLEASYDGVETIDVVVDPAARTRPAGMTQAEARAAVEQVIYTLQAAVQERAPVQFRTRDNPIDQVYGVPTAQPLAQGSPLQVLSHMSVTTPEQGAVVEADTLRFTGLANSFEANVVWEVRQGDRTVLGPEPVTAEGWMGEQLFVFDGRVDISGLAPGEYTFWATTDDPTGGTEGIGAMTDDKQFTVR